MLILRAGLIAVITLCCLVRNCLAIESCSDETALLSSDANALIPLRQAANRIYFDLRDKKTGDCDQFNAAIENWENAVEAHLSAYAQHSERCAPLKEMVVPLVDGYKAIIYSPYAEKFARERATVDCK